MSALERLQRDQVIDARTVQGRTESCSQCLDVVVQRTSVILTALHFDLYAAVLVLG